MDQSLSDIAVDYDRLRATVSDNPFIPVDTRISYLRSLKDGIVRMLPELRAAVDVDLGKPSLEADASEIAPVLVEIRHALQNIRRWTKPERPRNPFFLPGLSASVAPEARGLVLILSPFNYPINLSLGPLVPAIAAGNRVVVKPSELTPSTSQVVADVVKASLPKDVVSVVQGGVDTARVLLGRQFDHIYFSGSPRVGRIIMNNAAKYLTPVTLELGGKSPAIVTPSCNLDLAVRKIAAAKFLNAGQTCIGVDYALVDSRIHDAFVERLVGHLTHVYGSTLESRLNNTSFGRIVSTDHAMRLKRLIDDTSGNSSHVVFGGDVDVSRRFVAPTVLVGVEPGDSVMEDEIFGPILPVIRTESIDESIRIAGLLPAPLTVYVFANDKDVERSVRRRLRSGAIVTNGVLVHFVHPNLPFGGTGQSGFGRGHGHAGFLTFSNQRAIVKNKNPFRSPLERLYAPYSPRIGSLLERLLKKL